MVNFVNSSHATAKLYLKINLGGKNDGEWF